MGQSCSEGLENADEGRRSKERTRIAAVLVDLFLPDSHGIETFDRLFRAAPQDSDPGPERCAR